MDAPPDVPPVVPPTPADLRDELIELEYRYLTESSFRSDELRDRIFQFYLLIVSTASAVIIGLVQFNQGDTNSPLPIDVGTFRWALGGLALVIGLIGVVMVPIFVRLRRVVIECLQGTVLLKRYTLNAVGEERFGDAFIWDDQTLPRDENYGSASFLLVLVFMTLDTVMLTLPLYLIFFELYRPLTALLATLLFFVPLLTGQVMLYRYSLWRQLTGALARNRFMDKCARLGMTIPPNFDPVIKKPLWRAFLVGGILFATLFVGLVLLDFFALPF